jgi:hypothetical protein
MGRGSFYIVAVSRIKLDSIKRFYWYGFFVVLDNIA